MEGNTESGMGKDVAARLDYAFLKVNSQSSVALLRNHIADVERHGFRSICLSPVLAGTVKKNYPHIRVCAVVSYPLGMDSLAAKTFAIQELIEQGIDEVDVMLDLFALTNENFNKVELEINRLGVQTKRAGVFMKAIIETPILNDSVIRRVTELLRGSPVPCVKTSTGYGREPTTLDAVKLLKGLAGSELRIKASGGIKDLYDVRAMVEAGADIIGTSNAVDIMEEVAATT